VSDGWPDLVAELIEHVAGTYREPVIAAGHSLGGFLTLRAAVQRPGLFRAIIIMDSPIPKRWTGTALQMLKRLGLVDRVTPAGVTRGRRSEWASAGQAIEHFGRKSNFRRFDPDCLRDYVTLGMRRHGGAVRLAFDPEIEYRIYRTIPHDLVRDLSALAVPAGFVCGEDSSEMRRPGLVDLRRHFRVARVPGGHLFPFEHPAEAAAAVCALARDLARAS
jgi:pimeloyl-ACP methyl ester carboxylesterase